MATDPRRHRRRLAMLGLGGFLVLAWLQISGFQTFLDLRQAWRQESQLETEISDLEQRIAELEDSVEGLEADDSEAILLLAREKLGLALDGQIVVKVPEKE